MERSDGRMEWNRFRKVTRRKEYRDEGAKKTCTEKMGKGLWSYDFIQIARVDVDQHSAFVRIKPSYEWRVG